MRKSYPPNFQPPSRQCQTSGCGDFGLQLVSAILVACLLAIPLGHYGTSNSMPAPKAETSQAGTAAAEAVKTRPVLEREQQRLAPARRL